MPAEWEPHAATWLAWPRDPQTWPERFAAMPPLWAELVRTLAASEEVHVLAGGEGVMQSARETLGRLPRVQLHDIATNDAWIRDYGPTFLVGPRGDAPAAVDWDYDAWGGKYLPCDEDRRAAERIICGLGYRRFMPGIVLEGGAIDVNGRGTVLTTDKCLIEAERNPDLRRRDVERFLRDFCGARHVIWLAGGIAGDDTDGHVDQVARFVGPSAVVAAVEQDRDDENYASLEENLQRLMRAKDQDGRPLEVVPLPMPRPLSSAAGDRLPASYANFYIANRQVLVPTFDDPSDSIALETLARLFPDRGIHPVRAVDLILGLGAIHCITQQQPAG